MSTGTDARGGSGGTGAGPGATEAGELVARVADVRTFRLAAFVGVLALTAAYVGVLREVTRVVGGTSVLVPTVVLSALAGVVAARFVGERTAAVLGVLFLVLGSAYYLTATGLGLSAVLTQTEAIVADAVALLTGLSVLRMVKADVWALGFAPAPVFLSWYLAARARYLWASVVGGLALLTLVLTGDATAVGTLGGVLGGVAAVGFGELDRRDGTLLQADVLVMLVALILVASLTLSLVPGGAARPLDIRPDDGGPSTVEASLTGDRDRAPILGSISLSPEVRFTVEADERRYWRTGVYDRFTGSSWIRTGRTTTYEGRLERPVGPREELVQTYTVESSTRAMPAAAEPVEVIGGAAEATRVSDQRNLEPTSEFIEGDRYRVRSLVPDATPEELRTAGDDYPDPILDRYLQLPESTTDRLRERTDEVVGDASTAYDAALAIERYLEENKEYSLDVERPDGNVADAFVFEMEAGYCTYYATAMVTMLRTEGIPARMAVGYTPGQTVGEDEYVVRGLNAHAWVEVYFPEYGWVRFDPTPAGPRRSAEVGAVREARNTDDGPRVDTDESAGQPLTVGPGTTENGGSTPGTTTPSTSFSVPPGSGTGIGIGFSRNPGGRGDPTTDNGTDTTGPVTATSASGPPGADRRGGGGSLPNREQTAVGAVVLLGAAAGAHRFGLADEAYRTARIHWQGSRGDPAADVDRAFDRLELVLARKYRPRRTGETVRAYADDVLDRGFDDDALRVVEIHERARYAGEVDRETADEAVDLVDRIARRRLPVVGRFAS